MREEHLQAISQATGLAYTASTGDKALLSATPLQNVRTIPLVHGRSLLHATTEIQGIKFSIYAVHISWDLAGTHQTRQIVEGVLSEDDVPHLIMLGDFNDEHHSSQNTILETVLVDAFTTMGLYPGEKVTWPSTGFDETEGAQTIDLVFFRRDFPALVLEADAPNLSPVLSDHKPVVALLRFPDDPDAPYTTDPFAEQRDQFRDFPPDGEKPPNLLANPGAEEGLDGWASAGGATTTGFRRNIGPGSGASMFAGSETLDDPMHPWSTLSQGVDLSGYHAVIDGGRGRLLASAWLASGTDIATDGIETSNILKTYDDGEVILELRDHNNALLHRVVSGRRDTLGWHPFAASIDIPPGTRRADWIWMAHNKTQSGTSNDAVLDDAYLGFIELAEPNRIIGPNLAWNPGAEDMALPSSTGGPDHEPGWNIIPDMYPLGPWGIALFPPNCHSGTACWFAHSLWDPDAPVSGTVHLSVEGDLWPWADEIDNGAVALRWGATLRTFEALLSGVVVLQILDGDGSVWAEFRSPALAAAEWTTVTQRTRMPPNARRVRLSVEVDLDRFDDGFFADEIFLVPERVAGGSR
jgi:endonuclease/exonuclease/phosphatase family metal-dependent hydrolase